MAAFLSAAVGGEVSDRDTICPMVSLEGENVGSVALHPDSTCVFRLLPQNRMLYHTSEEVLPEPL